MHFQDKSITDFKKIKNKLKETVYFRNRKSALRESACYQLKKWNRTQIIFGGYFPKHLQSIYEGKFNPKTKLRAEDIKN
jgi:hypothetical protein